MTDRLLTLDEWVDEFQPIQGTEGELFFSTYGEFIEELKSRADEIAAQHGTREHQHIWTRVDGDSGRLILLNGWHTVNRLDYCLSELPWGDGTDTDRDVYIEVTYEE